MRGHGCAKEDRKGSLMLIKFKIKYIAITE